MNQAERQEVLKQMRIKNAVDRFQKLLKANSGKHMPSYVSSAASLAYGYFLGQGLSNEEADAATLLLNAS